MPRSVDLFICSPDPLDAVAKTVADLAGFEVTPGESGSWIVRDGSVQAVLDEHRRSDAGELPLSRYPYVMSAEVPDGVRPQDSAPAALLRQVVQKLQAKPGWMTLMVLDMQYRETPSQEVAASPEVPA